MNHLITRLFIFILSISFVSLAYAETQPPGYNFTSLAVSPALVLKLSKEGITKIQCSLDRMNCVVIRIEFDDKTELYVRVENKIQKMLKALSIIGRYQVSTLL